MRPMVRVQRIRGLNGLIIITYQYGLRFAIFPRKSNEQSEINIFLSQNVKSRLQTFKAEKSIRSIIKIAPELLRFEAFFMASQYFYLWMIHG